MASDRLLLRDVIGGFAPGQGLRAALLLTYSFDGRWLEEGLVPDLFDRPVTTAIVLRDGNNVVAEAPSVRYHRANAAFSTRVFHPNWRCSLRRTAPSPLSAVPTSLAGGLSGIWNWRRPMRCRPPAATVRYSRPYSNTSPALC